MIKNIVLILFFQLILLLSSPINTYASDNIIKVRGYQHGLAWYPLTQPSGTPPLSSYLTTTLYGALKNQANFGPLGTVSCSVDVKSNINVVTQGSLVDNQGNLLVDIFFGGAKFTNLTEEEATELGKFVEAGGILYLTGMGWVNDTPGRGPEYNLLFEKLNMADKFSTMRFDPGASVQSSQPEKTITTDGPFGQVGSLSHNNYTIFQADKLKGVVQGLNTSNYLVHESKVGKGYVVISGYSLFLNVHTSDSDNMKYFLNLFSLGCRDDWRDNSKVLDVPSFKQGLKAYDGVDPVWENQIYDDGDRQALFCDNNGNGATMAECGCALTSIAMVMKYFGVNNLANGSGLSPGSLNDYFKQNSRQTGNIYSSYGFIGGNVIWQSASNATALANRVYISQTKLDQPTRENFSLDKVKQNIDEGKPVIVKVVSRFGIHWVVVKGYDPGSNRLIINDPIQSNKLSGYTYLDEQYTPEVSNSMVIFKETHSDFSSFQVTSTSPIYIIDQDGNPIGEYSFDEFYGDATSEELVSTSSEGIYTVVLKTPSNGNIYVRTTSVDPLFITSTNIEGDSISKSINPTVTDAIYIFLYNEENSGNEIIQEIEFNVKADSDSKWINIKNQSVFHVTIFSQDSIHASSIDQSSIRFGKNGSEMSLKSCIKDLNDMDGDGLSDLTCKFEMKKTGIDILTKYIILTAQTLNGFDLKGIGEIEVK